jgi:hypothetical protein
MSTQDDDLGDIKLPNGNTFIYMSFKNGFHIDGNRSPANNDITLPLNGMSITAPQGALSAEPIRINVSDSVTVTTSPVVLDTKSDQGHQSACRSEDILERLSLGIPKKLREEIFGDLLELRAQKKQAGDSHRQILWFTVSQLFISIVLGLARRGWLAAIIEWLTRVAH